MRLVFAGTPEVALPSLARLVSSRHEVVAVLTRPDSRVGRGRRVSRSPVATFADEAGIPVLQFPTLRDGTAVSDLADLRPDVCPVVAYGALVPAPCLAVPTHGWVNLHFSVLPAWRGFPTEDAQADTALMNRCLQDYIDTMPAQYYWVHKRFKTRPPGEPDPYAARADAPWP